MYKVNKQKQSTNKVLKCKESSLDKGFGTLYVVIIIGIIVLSLSLWLSTGSFWSIQNGIKLKVSQQTRYLSEACAEVALEVLREDNSYSGSSNVFLGENNCEYTISNIGGDSRRIYITASIGNVVRKLQVETSAFNPLIISSWRDNP